VHPESLFRELAELADGGFDTRLLKIDPRCHVVTESHLQWEAQGTYAADLGTTKRGIGPAYADKAYRTGIQAKDVPALSAHLLQAPVHGNILCEGAQGIWLDLDWGSYPYVTSSTTAPHGACSIGFSVRQIRNIIGVAKAYDTRVGTDPNFPESLKDDPQLQLLQKAGSEYGATTGRIRKCNWLNLDYLNQAVQLSGMSHLIINKVDILRDVGIFQFYWKNQLYSFDSISAWLLNVQSILMRDNPTLHVTFSMSPTFESGMVGQIFLNSLM
jgi:adenylosuccinate synthase